MRPNWLAHVWPRTTRTVSHKQKPFLCRNPPALTPSSRASSASPLVALGPHSSEDTRPGSAAGPAPCSIRSSNTKCVSLCTNRQGDAELEHRQRWERVSLGSAAVESCNSANIIDQSSADLKDRGPLKSWTLFVRNTLNELSRPYEPLKLLPFLRCAFTFHFREQDFDRLRAHRIIDRILLDWHSRFDSETLRANRGTQFFLRDNGCF